MALSETFLLHLAEKPQTKTNCTLLKKCTTENKKKKCSAGPFKVFYFMWIFRATIKPDLADKQPSAEQLMKIIALFVDYLLLGKVNIFV